MRLEDAKPDAQAYVAASNSKNVPVLSEKEIFKNLKAKARGSLMRLERDQ